MGAYIVYQDLGQGVDNCNAFVAMILATLRSVADKVLTVGQKVIRLGEQLKLTQVELANALGVERGTVATYKARPNANPSPDKVRRLAEEYLVPVYWFYDGEDTEAPIDPDMPEEFFKDEPTNILPTNKPEHLKKDAVGHLKGDLVSLPVWRGVLAGADDEVTFEESEWPETRAIPAYITGGDYEQHVLCIASGQSMADRINHADRVVVRLDPDVPAGCMVVARSPEDKNYVKVLRKNPQNGRLELHSVNGAYKVITELAQWRLKGGVIAILGPYEGGRNIEFDDGRYLRG
jgi:transcriptional regulator with XRE-family HTH domain